MVLVHTEAAVSSIEKDRERIKEKVRREREENPERCIRRYRRFRYAVIAVFLLVCLYPILEVVVRIIKGLAKLLF